MPDQVLEIATPDPSVLRPFLECMDNYGVGEPEDPWANNCLAADAVAYSNGLIARSESVVDLRFDPNELALCTRLANEVAGIMGDFWPGMYSGNTPVTSSFWVTSAIFGPHSVVDADLIRAAFGGALYDEAEVVVEALEERGDWWNEIQRAVADCEEDAESDEDGPDFDAETEVFAPWRAVIRWFTERPELHGSSFVRVSVEPHHGVRGGCVFPWFVVGLTKRGSLVGLTTNLVRG